MDGVHEVFYGSVSFLRGRCPLCKKISLISDGKFLCCGKLVDTENVCIEATVRIAEGEYRKRPFSKAFRQRLLEKQGGRCYWCGHLIENGWYIRRGKWYKLKPHVDHYVAWVYSRDSTDDNLVVSCNVCNSLKNSKIFDTEAELREYLWKQRQKKGVIFDEDL